MNNMLRSRFIIAAGALAGFLGQSFIFPAFAQAPVQLAPVPILRALLESAKTGATFTAPRRIAVSAQADTRGLVLLVRQNPSVAVPLAKVMGGEVGVVLSTALGALHAGAAQSARGIRDELSHVLRVLTLSPALAQEASLTQGVLNVADAFRGVRFGIDNASPPSQSSLRHANPIAAREGELRVTPQSEFYIPGISIARAADPENGEAADPFLKELERLYDELFAPISVFGVPMVVPAGQPTKAIAYLKEVEQRIIETLRPAPDQPAVATLEDQSLDEQLRFNLGASELMYDIKTALLACRYTPRDADKKIKRFLVDNYVKPALDALRGKEERELDIYNADSNYGGEKLWSEEEQEALRENRRSGANRSTEEVIRRVAENRIGRAARLRESNSYQRDEGGGVYVHRAGRITEDAELSGREVVNLIAGDTDVSLAAYAKVIAKYIAEDTLNLWVNSSSMNTSDIFNDIESRVIARFLATRVMDNAEKKKVIEDAANAALKQLGLTLNDALKSGDEALAAYRSILNSIGSFANIYCKHKDEIDGMLAAADVVIAETGSCVPGAPAVPEDPNVAAAKSAAVAELKKFESSCQPAAATFIQLATIMKRSLLQLLRDQIKEIYGTHGMLPPTDAEINGMFGSQESADTALADLYDQFYDFYAEARQRRTGVDEVSAGAEREKTTNALHAIALIALRGHALRFIDTQWLINIKDIAKTMKPKNGRCAVPDFTYDPTLARLFERIKDAALRSIASAPSLAKQVVGDVYAAVSGDLYGSKDKPKSRDIVTLERQLRAVDELVRRILGLARDSQSDLDAGLASYQEVKKSADAIELVRTAFIKAKKESDTRGASAKAAEERKLAEDVKKSGRTGALARQRQADARADAERAQAEAKAKETATGLAKEAARNAVRAVGEEAKQDLQELQCPASCASGKKYQRVPAEPLANCTTGTVSVAVENITCCDFGETQINPTTRKVEYFCKDRVPPDVTRYDGVIRVFVGPPGLPGRSQYGSVWCADLPRELRPEECPVPNGQAIADAFCVWDGDPKKAGNATGREFYKMTPESL